MATSIALRIADLELRAASLQYSLSLCRDAKTAKLLARCLDRVEQRRLKLKAEVAATEIVVEKTLALIQKMSAADAGDALRGLIEDV